MRENVAAAVHSNGEVVVRSIPVAPSRKRGGPSTVRSAHVPGAVVPLQGRRDAQPLATPMVGVTLRRDARVMSQDGLGVEVVLRLQRVKPARIGEEPLLG